MSGTWWTCKSTRGRKLDKELKKHMGCNCGKGMNIEDLWQVVLEDGEILYFDQKALAQQFLDDTGTSCAD